MFILLSVVLLTLITITYAISIVSNVVSFAGSVLILSILSWKLSKCIHRYQSNNTFITTFKKAILITGCDRGFGNHLALKLNNEGFVVYATVLDDQSDGAKSLKTDSLFPNKIKIIQMDVTNDNDVLNAFKYVEKDLTIDGNQLWAVVNVAGILTIAHIDWGTIESSYKKVYEVNTIGTVRVTRSFLPLIREAKGRVINISSMAGKIYPSLHSSYCMSKSAVISFSDALRREMSKWGVNVCVILPGKFKTFILSQQNIEQFMQNEWINTSESVKQVYGQKYFDRVRESVKGVYTTTGSDNLDLVIDAIIDGLRNESPKAVYEVWGNWKSSVVMFLNEYLPIGLMDRYLEK